MITCVIKGDEGLVLLRGPLAAPSEPTILYLVQF